MLLNMNISAIIHVSFFSEIRYQQSYTLPVSFTFLFTPLSRGFGGGGGLDRYAHQARDGAHRDTLDIMQGQIRLST